MSRDADQSQRIAALEAHIERMQREHAALVESLQRTIRRLEAENRELRRRLATYERRGHDSGSDDGHDSGSTASSGTTPPATGQPAKRKPERKRPGRKRGKGPFRFRAMPEPTEPLVQVPPPAACRRCGAGKLEAVASETVTITTLPPMPRPIVTPYAVPTCRCTACGARTRGVHPDLAPDQTGASAHRFSPRVMAIAHVLHHVYRLPVCTLPPLLRDLFGLAISKAAITRDALRRATTGAVGKAYRELRQQVPQADYIYTDDTYWPIHGDGAFLMGFSTMNRPDRVPPAGAGTDGATPVAAAVPPGRDPPRAAVPGAVVYQVRRRHTNEEVRELVPSDCAATMKTDRFSSYDAEALADVAQDKCVAHIKRNVADARELQHPGARSFTRSLTTLIDGALALWHRFRDGGIARSTYRRCAAPLKKERDALLRDRRLTDPHNQRLLDGLGTQCDRGRLLAFLDDPYLEPTNNRAERALRGAVISRRLSHGSKTDRGAEAFCAFLSVLQTLRNCGAPLLSALHRLLLGEPLEAVVR